MKTAWIVTTLAAAGLVSGFVMLAGCEVDSATETVRVDPTTAVLKPNQSATFTASGGYDYRWSLKEQTWGYLSPLTGPSVTYTSFYDPGSNSTALQILTVVSTMPDMHRDVTNVPPNPTDFTAEAYITHISSNSTLVIP